MPTPFSPAMDPYIERTGIWGDFHLELISATRRQLNRKLPAGYATIVELQVRLLPAGDAGGAGGGPARHRQPDVAVVGSDGNASAGSEAGPAVASLAPRTVRLPTPLVEVRQATLQVVSVPDREVVSTIEVLSPSNKRGDGRDVYLLKRGESWAADSNLLEIDLLREGRRVEPEAELPPAGPTYCATLTRAGSYPLMQVYSWPADASLPTLPVPLRPPDADVPLDLREAVDAVYDDCGYRDLLRYDPPAAASS